jgi:phytanoyl-CoA hydroxylase
MNMRRPTTARYDRDGYTLVHHLLGPADLARTRGEVTAICRGERGDIDGTTPARPGEADDDMLARHLCIHFPHKISPAMLALARHPEVVDVLTGVVGPNVKMMQSMLFIKAGGRPGQAWHQDEAHIPTRDRSLTAVWIALDDATVDNGCLWALPGSHRDGVLHPVRAQDDPRFDGTPEAHGFDDRGAVPLEVPAGSAVVFDGYLLHRSLPNRTDGPRRALVNHYMRAESLLPWRVPGAGETMATVDDRDVVMVAGRDPYAARGTVDRHRPRIRRAGGAVRSPT